MLAPNFTSKNVVLVLEDEDLARKALLRIFGRENYEVIGAKRGSEAIELINKHKIDAFLLDIQMDYPDGIDVAKYIQQVSPSKPILLCTAFADSQDYQNRVRREKLRIANWVQKPINEKTLLASVQNEIERNKILSNLIYLLNEIGVTPVILNAIVDAVKPLIKIRNNSLDFSDLEKLQTDITSTLSPHLLKRKQNLSSDINFIAFQEKKDELLKKYKKGYVAFLDGKFIDHDNSWDNLIKKVYSKYKRINVFTSELKDEEPIIELISPLLYDEK